MKTDRENDNVVDINSRKKTEIKKNTCDETPVNVVSDENENLDTDLSEQDILDLYAGEMKGETPNLWDRIVAGIDEVEAQEIADKPAKTSRFPGRRIFAGATTIAALIIICVIVAPLMGDRSKNKSRISDKAENNIDMIGENDGAAESAADHEDSAMIDSDQAEEQQAEEAESAPRPDTTTNGGAITDADQSANSWRMECRLVFAECGDGAYKAEVKKIVRITEASGASSAIDDTTVPAEGDEITITIDEAQLDRIETVYGSVPTEGMEISCVVVPWGDGGFKIIEL